MGNKSALEEKVVFLLNNVGGVPPYERNYRKGIPGRRLEADFAWPRYKVGIEVQGGTWLPKSGKASGHVGAGQTRDFKKMNLFIENDWKVLQWSSDMIRDDPVFCIEQLKRVLKQRGYKENNE